MARRKGEGAFIDANPDIDLLDPRNLEDIEYAEREARKAAPATAKEILNRRRVAYSRVFAQPGKATQADIDFVMNDLAKFCRGFAPKFDLRDGPNAAKLQDIKEGRAEVFYRILDFSRLDETAVFLKYTDAQSKQGD